MHTFSIGESLRFGWETFKKRPAIFIGSAVIIAAISWFSGAIGGALDEGPAAALGSLVSVVISMFVGMGTIAFYLKAHDNVNQLQIADLWHPRPFWKYVGASILYALMVAAVVAPFLIAAAVVGVGALFSGDGTFGLAALILVLLAIAAALAVSSVFFFAMFAVIDRSLGPIEALKESARITEGIRLKIFLFMLAAGAINILGMLLLFVGLLVTMPLTSLAMAHAYRLREHSASEMAVSASPSA